MHPRWAWWLTRSRCSRPLAHGSRRTLPATTPWHSGWPEHVVRKWPPTSRGPMPQVIRSPVPGCRRPSHQECRPTIWLWMRASPQLAICVRRSVPGGRVRVCGTGGVPWDGGSRRRWVPPLPIHLAAWCASRGMAHSCSGYMRYGQRRQRVHGWPSWWATTPGTRFCAQVWKALRACQMAAGRGLRWTPRGSTWRRSAMALAPARRVLTTLQILMRPCMI